MTVHLDFTYNLSENYFRSLLVSNTAKVALSHHQFCKAHAAAQEFSFLASEVVMAEFKEHFLPWNSYGISGGKAIKTSSSDKDIKVPSVEMFLKEMSANFTRDSAVTANQEVQPRLKILQIPLKMLHRNKFGDYAFVYTCFFQY